MHRNIQQDTELRKFVFEASSITIVRFIYYFTDLPGDLALAARNFICTVCIYIRTLTHSLSLSRSLSLSLCPATAHLCRPSSNKCTNLPSPSLSGRQSWVYAGYNFFLGVAPFLMGLVDRDVSARCALAHPPLYMSGRLSMDLNVAHMVR